jgi:uncharacterized protein (TIGR00661 family)
MVPVARKLLQMNNNIFIGSGEEHLSFFHEELPNLKYIVFPGFKPRYSRIFPQYLSLLFKMPVLLYHIAAEHQRVKRIIKEYNIDIVISDNRFGLWHSNSTTVYFTHQLLIPFPERFRFLEASGRMLHNMIIRRYSLCFVPDLPGDINLTGRLAHGFKIPYNVRYTGILSRFDNTNNHQSRNPLDFSHNTVILSGPEPQRSILKEKLTAILKDRDQKTVIFEGKPGIGGEITPLGNITFISHLPTGRMKDIIKSSGLIISRSGYTTIMELVSLKCTALIIPTPGQTEQEYLAEYLADKGWFSTISQDELTNNLQLSNTGVPDYASLENQSETLLHNALEELLEHHHKKSQAKKSGEKSHPNLSRRVKVKP